MNDNIVAIAEFVIESTARETNAAERTRINVLVATKVKQQIRRRDVAHVAVMQHFVTIGLNAHQHRPRRQQAAFFQ